VIVKGNAKNFVRVLKKDGSYEQGGSNESLIIDVEDGKLLVRTVGNYFLINGRKSNRYICVLLDEIKIVQVDRTTEHGQPIPSADIEVRSTGLRTTWSPNREPIQTAAALEHASEN